jgi:hypothetical protein
MNIIGQIVRLLSLINAALDLHLSQAGLYTASEIPPKRGREKKLGHWNPIENSHDISIKKSVIFQAHQSPTADQPWDQSLFELSRSASIFPTT